MELFLIRHAESVWNRERRIQGSEDPGLSEEGIRQAESLAKILKRENIQIIYASGLKRCAQTAKAISKQTKAPIEFLSEIEEIILGDWQGKTAEQVKREYPKIYNDWLDSPSKAKIPGWEGIAKFTRRVHKAFDFIISSNSANSICVVTHWGVIAAYLSKILNTDFDRFFKGIRIDNCSLSKITYDGKSAIVQYINDTRHLIK